MTKYLKFKYHWEITPSKSHKKDTIMKPKKITTPQFLENLLLTPTVLSGETIR